MARLLINPGSPAAWEVQLKTGPNSLGRGPMNDFQITDPSVSGTHCHIVVENGNATIKDMGSTNGTFVNRAPVKEALLKSGQTIHLGEVCDLV
jgi:pSer/pThr/pTyr-binding forkhead associated (FHA) protein